MGTGSVSGDEGRGLRLGISLFLRDDGGYTTVAVAVALLVSLSLVFSAASAEWVMSRSNEVQAVADASAMAGANVVSAYATVAQVLDACVLSLGLAGIVTYGAGLVASCVPGLGGAAAKLCEAGGRVLDARRDLARSAARGLKALERALPAIIVANSASCVRANGAEGIGYEGCAIPLPTGSKSDFSSLEVDVGSSEMERAARGMGEATARAEGAREEASRALEHAWEEDCGSPSYCMRERASTLAGLAGWQNPMYDSPESWNFGVALLRARRYYAARLSAQGVTGSTGAELTDSACRRAFYAYALAEVRAGSYSRALDGTESVDLPELPHTADEMRSTTVYTDAAWPCTAEDGGRTLHSSLSCPGARGSHCGSASLADLEAGRVRECPECAMSIREMGRVASASTNIENGFEHHWREVVEASHEYVRAKAEQSRAERDAKEAAERGSGTFQQALDQLAVIHPTLCPPGAYGCVAVVVRGGGQAVPSELTRAFLSAGALPPGAAVSAAVLAPDDATAENNVLADFWDSLDVRDSFVGGALDGTCELWGRLLVGYGSAYGRIGDAAGGFLDNLDGVTGGTVGAWLRGKVSGMVRSARLEPVDMRQRKPVLVSTQKVCDKAGLSKVATVRRLVTSLPDHGSAEDYARALGLWVLDEYGEITVAEVPIPGTDMRIPLTIDLAEIARAA